jgi:molecular chaperone DnaK (HSP70)
MTLTRAKLEALVADLVERTVEPYRRAPYRARQPRP